MCSYNRVNGPFACDNADTLKTILKGEIGFKGFVTSDWGGVHSVLFINQGLDMEMPGTLPAGSPLAVLLNSFFLTAPPAAPGAPPDADALAGILGGSIPEEPLPDPTHLGAFPRDTDGTTMREALKNGTVSEATITAAARRVLIVVDGFTVSVAAALAARIDENVLDYCVFGHCSAEHAHRALLTHLEVKPLLDLGMRLGEGSGAAVALSVVRASLGLFTDMATFEGAGVSEKSA